MKKPRQQRAARYKPPAAEVPRWRDELGTYVLDAPGCAAEIAQRAGAWHMRLEINGKRFAGTRGTLEEAYKALSDLLFKEAKRIWLTMESSMVIAPWGYCLPGEETIP